MVDEQTYAQQLDLLRFQTGEIAAARLQPDEETACTGSPTGQQRGAVARTEPNRAGQPRRR